jgi:cell division protein FtsL
MDQVRSLTQAYSQAPWRKQMQWIGLFLLFLVFSALVAGIYLSVTARAATVGREILLLQGEIERLELENADLDTRVATLNSSTIMEERALAMGFQPIQRDQTLFIVVPGYVQPDHVTLAPPPAPVTVVAAALPPDFTQSLIDWLRQRVSLPSLSLLEVDR